MKKTLSLILALTMCLSLSACGGGNDAPVATGGDASVGRKIGRSGSTVAKYVQMNGVPQSIRFAVQNLANKK